MPKAVQHHLFTHDDSLCLINVEHMAAFAVDDPATKDALKDITAGLSIPIDDGARDLLEKFNLLSTTDTRPGRIRASEPCAIHTIMLFVTQQCNMRCTYCYGDGGSYGSGGEMSRQTAHKAVDWLIGESQQVKKLRIGFFGGEPLLNFPLIQEVVHYALRRGGEQGKEFAFGMATNASLLDEEKIAFLKKHEIETIVSLDGPEELQDAQRPFRNGKGSYQTIVPKIRNLLEAMPETACRATIVGGSDPVEIDNALCDLGFQQRTLAPASPCLMDTGNDRRGSGRDLSGMLQKVETDARKIIEAIRTRDSKALRCVLGSGLMRQILEQFINHRKKYFTCRAGMDYVSVSSAGDVYLCHRFVGMKEQHLGDIFNGKLKRESYLRDYSKLNKKCVTCFAKYICADGCYYDNLGASGSVFEPAEDICVLMRRTTELAAAVSSRLTEDDKVYLVKEKIIKKKPAFMDLF